MKPIDSIERVRVVLRMISLLLETKSFLLGITHAISFIIFNTYTFAMHINKRSACSKQLQRDWNKQSTASVCITFSILPVLRPLAKKHIHSIWTNIYMQNSYRITIQFDYSTTHRRFQAIFGKYLERLPQCPLAVSVLSIAFIHKIPMRIEHIIPNKRNACTSRITIYHTPTWMWIDVSTCQYKYDEAVDNAHAHTFL